MVDAAGSPPSCRCFHTFTSVGSRCAQGVLHGHLPTNEGVCREGPGAPQQKLPSCQAATQWWHSTAGTLRGRRGLHAPLSATPVRVQERRRCVVMELAQEWRPGLLRRCYVVGGRRMDEVAVLAHDLVAVFDPARGAWLEFEALGCTSHARSSHKVGGGEGVWVVPGWTSPLLPTHLLAATCSSRLWRRVRCPMQRQAVAAQALLQRCLGALPVFGGAGGRLRQRRAT